MDVENLNPTLKSSVSRKAIREHGAFSIRDDHRAKASFEVSGTFLQKEFGRGSRHMDGTVSNFKVSGTPGRRIGHRLPAVCNVQLGVKSLEFCPD